MEQNIANLEGQLKEIEEQTATQQSTDAEKIATFELTRKSFEQDRTQLTQQYSESISELEQEIKDLKIQITESEVSNKQFPINSLRIPTQYRGSKPQTIGEPKKPWNRLWNKRTKNTTRT